MRVNILASAHGRQVVTELCYKALQRQRTLASEKGITLSLTVVASDKADVELAQRYAEHVAIAPNDLLGEKHNVGLAKALATNPDYIMQLGSDDFLSLDFWEYATPYLQDGTTFFGFNSIYFCHAPTYRFKHYNYLQVFGAGRFVRTDIVRAAAECVLVRYLDSASGAGGSVGKGAVEWIPESMVRGGLHEVIDDTIHVKLWNPDRMRGLDTDSEDKIVRRHGMHKARPRQVQTGGIPTVLDVKTGDNLHSFDAFHGRLLSELEGNDVVERFGLQELDGWNGLMGGRSMPIMSF